MSENNEGLILSTLLEVKEEVGKLSSKVEAFAALEARVKVLETQSSVASGWLKGAVAIGAVVSSVVTFIISHWKALDVTR